MLSTSPLRIRLFPIVRYPSLLPTGKSTGKVKSIACCYIWRVRFRSTLKLKVAFANSEFGLARQRKGEFCVYDYLEINMSGQPKRRICGNWTAEDDATFVSTSAELRFRSDFSNEGRGFVIEASAIPTSENNDENMKKVVVFEASRGSFAFPPSTAVYPPDVSTRYRIRPTEPNVRVELDFKVGRRDVLQQYRFFIAPTYVLAC